ncbi:MAG: 3-phosphoshikimate 1-carboxyvinyltransferase [Caulobacteraceae bacterium]|nr:3-phosphoshikimate 1-carboxyvinyltransferase [Caulobacteraceae bacterium]
MAPAGMIARPGGALRGRVRVPSDKSISHRALILGGLARGVTTVEGLLEADDVMRTAGAMRAFGVTVERSGAGLWRVTGEGGLKAPDGPIDCGNAGTAARLILGAAAGFSIRATVTGDASLRRRPMGRVLDPLGRMGATWICRDEGRLPVSLRGGELTAITYRLPQPSAQVKSAILLAALRARGETRVIEPAPTRDHTERMLRAFGAQVRVEDSEEGRVIGVAGGQDLEGARVRAPGDPSSAAFILVAALITPGSAVTAEGVLLNPLRTGLFDTLREMGADLTIENPREEGGERVGDVTARHGPLTGVTVLPSRAPAMIDEYPVLAVAAAYAEGPTVMRGLGELRLKESDRIAAMAAVLAACGVEAQEEPEGLVVMGTGGSGPAVRGGGAVRTHGDHRIAMSALVLGLGARAPVSVDEAGMIATSFPGFVKLMAGLGADIEAA